MRYDPLRFIPQCQICSPLVLESELRSIDCELSGEEEFPSQPEASELTLAIGPIGSGVALQRRVFFAANPSEGGA